MGVVLLTICGLLSPPPATATGTDLPLRELAQRQGLAAGASAVWSATYDDPAYRYTLQTEFNSLTPSLDMKWNAIHPTRDVYNFTPADSLVVFAEQNEMAVRGHTLVWHIANPDWLTTGNFTSTELLSLMRDHINSVVGHYKGRVKAWDVVNEAIDDAGAGLRTSVWSGIGPQYIDRAFEFARAADPNARLYYNDWGADLPGPKADAVYQPRLRSEAAWRPDRRGGIPEPLHDLRRCPAECS